MFHVGQKVECISVPDDVAWYWPPSIVKGGRYTVRDVDARYIPQSGNVGLRLEEYTHSKLVEVSGMGLIEPAFPGSRFRPIVEKKTDISIFTRMLTPTDKEFEP